VLQLLSATIGEQIAGIGVASHQAQCLALTAATDQDWRVRLLDWTRRIQGAFELVVLPPKSTTPGSSQGLARSLVGPGFGAG
jgi:hypothetical protein